jgi:hypothetical protein
MLTYKTPKPILPVDMFTFLSDYAIQSIYFWAGCGLLMPSCFFPALWGKHAITFMGKGL